MRNTQLTSIFRCKAGSRRLFFFTAEHHWPSQRGLEPPGQRHTVLVNALFERSVLRISFRDPHGCGVCYWHPFIHPPPCFPPLFPSLISTPLVQVIRFQPVLRIRRRASFFVINTITRIFTLLSVSPKVKWWRKL